MKITEVQVDCSNLTKEQIHRMAYIVVKNGYSIWESKLAFKAKPGFTFFRKANTDNDFALFDDSSDCITITFDQFIEKFDEKELTIQEINQEIERLQALKKEKESDVVGKWCFVWGNYPEKAVVIKVKEVVDNRFVSQNGIYWKNAIPLPEPLQSQLESEYQKLVN